MMTSDERTKIEDLSKCIVVIRDYYKRKRKNRIEEAKKAELEEKEKEAVKFGFGVIDGNIQKIDNFRIDPPGCYLDLIFRNLWWFV